MGNGSTLILKVMPDVSSTLLPPLFHVRLGSWSVMESFFFFFFFFFFVNAHYTSYPMKYSFHLGNVRTACVCRCSKKKKKKKKNHTPLLFSWKSPIRTKESWNETAWAARIKQVVERNTRDANVASLRMLTLHSFMLFKVWNVVNVREMSHENHNDVWQSKTSYVECSRCWQRINSHTHKSNFMPFWYKLSRTWKRAFHYRINLLCIQVWWGWKLFYWAVGT